MKTLSIDIETFSSVDLKKSGLYKYVQSPDFQILLFAYSINSGPTQIVDLAQGEQIPHEIVTALADPNITKHAYNAAFEWYCLNKFFQSPLDSWRCTMLHGLYCGYTAGLGPTAVALGLPNDKRKMSVGTSLIRLFCTPTKPTKKNGERTRTLPHHEPEKWELFKEYCIQDVVTEMEVDRRLDNFPVPKQEQRLWEIDQQINAGGVAVDSALVDGALYISDVSTSQLTEEAIKLTGLQNPNSTQQLTNWLSTQGVEVENLQKETVSNLTETTTGDVKRALEIRQELSKTSVKKYQAMKEAVCEDGRVRGLLQFYGANRTGRWAGRLVQIQNLPRNYLETLSHARELVKEKKVDALKLIYGNVPDTLSQLVRTAFVPSEENVLLVSDFSAIEARVIAWLAGEQWRLDVFNSHGKIYEASASQMFGVPLELIKKGNPEYELRQKGKVSELALGYQGAAGALISMGALNMGLSEEELPDVVRRWRSSNKRIVDLWYSIENAALAVMRTGQPAGVKGLLLARESDIINGLDFLTITLPSGRKLFYAKPFLSENDFGKEAVHYWGMDQTTKKWSKMSTYGGKIVENCLGGDTQVLTDRGWVKLKNVRNPDLVWDGVGWVEHDGLIEKGFQPILDLDGVRMTFDHKVLTEGGWRRASSCKGYNRYEVTLPDSNQLQRVGREKITLEHSMRLRKRDRHGCYGIQKRKAKVMWLPKVPSYIKEQENPWNVGTSNLCRLAVNDRQMYTAFTPSLEKLRGPRYTGRRGLAEQFQKFLAGHGPDLSTGINPRKNQQSRTLRTGELPMGYVQKTGEQQEKQPQNRHTLGQHDSCTSIRHFRYRPNYTILSTRSRMARSAFIQKAGRTEPVYDIMNAGPRHRFVVKGESGPFIVHNCVQAIARDCLAESLIRLHGAGYLITFHVHDEIVVEEPEGGRTAEELASFMGQPIDWAPGLPLTAAGFETEFYMKD